LNLIQDSLIEMVSYLNYIPVCINVMHLVVNDDLIDIDDKLDASIYIMCQLPQLEELRRIHRTVITDLFELGKNKKLKYINSRLEKKYNANYIGGKNNCCIIL